jgi:hypothetical protein
MWPIPHDGINLASPSWVRKPIQIRRQMVQSLPAWTPQKLILPQQSTIQSSPAPSLQHSNHALHYRHHRIVQHLVRGPPFPQQKPAANHQRDSVLAKSYHNCGSNVRGSYDVDLSKLTCDLWGTNQPNTHFDDYSVSVIL